MAGGAAGGAIGAGFKSIYGFSAAFALKELIGKDCVGSIGLSIWNYTVEEGWRITFVDVSVAEFFFSRNLRSRA